MTDSVDLASLLNCAENGAVVDNEFVKRIVELVRKIMSIEEMHKGM